MGRYFSSSSAACANAEPDNSQCKRLRGQIATGGTSCQGVLADKQAAKMKDDLQLQILVNQSKGGQQAVGGTTGH